MLERWRDGSRADGGSGRIDVRAIPGVLLAVVAEGAGG